MSLTFDSLYMMFAESYNDNKEKGLDCWSCIGLTVPCKLLSDLYLKFLKDGIPAIETLPEEKKRHYFDIAKKYYTESKDTIRASKAAYVLALITSND